MNVLALPMFLLGLLALSRKSGCPAVPRQPAAKPFELPPYLRAQPGEDRLSPFGPPPPIAPVTVDTATLPQAANLLKLWLVQNPTPAAFGFEGSPSRPVQNFQKVAKLPQDGIVGPAVRAAAASVGVTLPPRPNAAAAVVKAPPPSIDALSLTQAANLLKLWLVQNPTPAAFGFDGSPSRPVQNFQKVAKLPQDGIVGPKVRAAAASVNVTLPPRPSKSAASVPAAPVPVPKQQAIAPTGPDPRVQAANLLKLWLSQNPTPEAFGYAGSPSKPVRKFQEIVRIKQDGIVGPETYAVAQGLGVKLPLRPAGPQWQSTRTPGQVKQAQAEAEALKKAANLLKLWLVQNPQPENWGSKGRPSKPVAKFQAIAKIKADGIIGPNTRDAAARVGVKLPPRPSATPPALETLNLKQAANLLKLYLTQNARNVKAFGFRGSPSAPVANFQRLANITQDGIVGPQVRQAAKSVGVTLPPRPGG